MIPSFLISLLPLAFWWRFRNVPLDRDYLPYAYPAIFKTAWLRDGHNDIKPPIIHWGYKLWWSCVSRLSFLSMIQKCRLPFGLLSSAACLTVSLTKGPSSGFVLALLLCSPTLWTHMANTEWLTVSLLSLCLAITPPASWAGWLALGLLPWVNQKNAPLIPFLAWALGLSFTWTMLPAFLAPSLVFLTYLALTGRIDDLVTWCWLAPAIFAKNRKFKTHTLGAANLLLPCIWLMAPFVAVMDWHSPWALVLGVMFLWMCYAKQVVPHHFILLAFPLAMAARPVPMTWVAFGIVWLLRDGLVWWHPYNIYRATFGSGRGNYGDMIADAAKIEAWIREHTAPDERIWVNGMDNQIYLNVMRKAVRVEIPELTGTPWTLATGDGVAPADPLPRVIVHCRYGCKEFDYEGYEPEMVSTIGLFTLMVKK